jgi:hypothetical protein
VGASSKYDRGKRLYLCQFKSLAENPCIEFGYKRTSEETVVAEEKLRLLFLKEEKERKEASKLLGETNKKWERGRIRLVKKMHKFYTTGTGWTKQMEENCDKYNVPFIKNNWNDFALKFDKKLCIVDSEFVEPKKKKKKKKKNCNKRKSKESGENKKKKRKKEKKIIRWEIRLQKIKRSKNTK